MRVQIDNPMYWGKGKDRKGYGAGSVLDIPEDIVEKNSDWMKATDAEPKAKAYNPDAAPKAAPDEKEK